MKPSPLALSLAIASAISSSVLQAQQAEKNTKETDDIEVIEVVSKRSVFGATKSNTPIVELARSLSIETSDDFIEKGALNLSQTTSYMAGVSAETYGFSTRGDWIHSRGLEIPRYRDSIQELFGSYNTTRAEIYTMEQVELLKGPASVLYGQGSPGGLVNFVSKTPRPQQSGEVNLQLGNYGRKQLGVDFTGALNDDASLQGRVVALYRDSDSQVDYVYDDTKLLMPSISFLPSDNTTLTLIGLFQDSSSDVAAQFIPIEGTLTPLPSGGFIGQDVYAGEPDFNHFDTQSTQITLLGEHAFDDAGTLAFTALWRDGEADYAQAWPVFYGAGNSRYLNSIVGLPVASETTVPRSFYQADNTSEQYAFDVRYSQTFNLADTEHEVLVGIQYQDVTTDSNTAYYYGGGALSGDFSYALDLANPVYTGAPEQAIFDAIYNDAPEQKVDEMGFYLSDHIRVDNWHITLGLRHDKVNNNDGTTATDDSQTSYSAGLLYTFDNGLSPYISYAESFQTVLGLDDNNNQLKPREGRQYEAGVKYEFNAFPGYVTAAYFDIEISNLDNPNTIPASAGQQLGVAKISGFEVEGNIDFGEFRAQFAAATLDGEDPDGLALPAEPDSNASIWLVWAPSDLEQLEVGGGVRYVGESISEQYLSESELLRYTTPSYTLIDFMVSYRINTQWDLALNVRNLTDKQYLTACLTRGDCFPGLRRSVNATVNYRF